MIEPTEGTIIHDFLKNCHIAIEWHSSLIQNDYDPTSNEVLIHSSIHRFDDDFEERIISLDNCLKKFHDKEKLGD